MATLNEYGLYWGGNSQLGSIMIIWRTILFAWDFWDGQGLRQNQRGADIRIPAIYKWIMKICDSVLSCYCVFIVHYSPSGNDWAGSYRFVLAEWKSLQLDPSALIAN